MNILRQVSLTAVTGFGLAMLILLGEIDLSVGSAQAVVGIAAVGALNATGNVALAILTGVGMGAAVGMVNGLLTVKARIGSFIVTLGMLSVLRGMAMVVTDAKSVRVEAPAFAELGTGYVGILPIPVIIMVILFVVIFYTLTNTMFGRSVYAVGGNRQASKLAGLPVDRIRLTVFLFSGILTALSALILASRLDSAQPNAGTGFEMKVISAVVLGGISMTGGVGKLTGAFIGMLILGVLSNGLTLLQVSSFWQDIVSGGVTILAVYMDVRRRESRSKKLVITSMEEKA
jgi:ribose transport system permease protein